MKRQIFLFLVFVFSCFANLHSQETAMQRQTPATDQIQQRKGEVVDYQKTLRRFESALKENDLSSVADLKVDLIAAMQKRINLMEAENSSDEKHLNELKEQKEILKSVEDFGFAEKGMADNASLEHLKKLQKFALNMERNFETQ